MSAVSDFAAKVKAYNDRQDAAITGVSSDIDALNAKIAELQSTQGQITPEDQALLDDIQARGDAIATKLEALDNLTPPPPPPPETPTTEGAAGNVANAPRTGRVPPGNPSTTT